MAVAITGQWFIKEEIDDNATITFDDGTGGPYYEWTGCPIGTAASDRVVLFAFILDTEDTAGVDTFFSELTSFTIGGVTAEYVGDSTYLPGLQVSNEQHWVVFAANVPTGTTCTIRANFSGSPSSSSYPRNDDHAYCTLSVAASSSIIADHDGSYYSDGTDASASVTVPTDGLAVSFSLHIDTSSISLSWSGATQQDTYEYEDGAYVRMSVATGTGGSPSVGYTASALEANSIVTLAINPAAGAGGFPYSQSFIFG